MRTLSEIQRPIRIQALLEIPKIKRSLPLISFVLGRGWDDEEIVTAFKQVGRTFAQDLKADHLKIRLIDPFGQFLARDR